MLKSIYKKIEEDFAFMKEYDFNFLHRIKSNVAPAVVFENKSNGNIVIRYSYGYHEFTGKHRLCATHELENMKGCYDRKRIHDNYHDIVGESTSLFGKYENQVNSVKEIVLQYLKGLRIK